MFRLGEVSLWRVVVITVIHESLLGLGCSEAKSFDILAKFSSLIVLTWARSRFLTLGFRSLMALTDEGGLRARLGHCHSLIGIVLSRAPTSLNLLLSGGFHESHRLRIFSEFGMGLVMTRSS